MLNKVLFIGNLTAEPESQNTNSGSVVCRLKVAINRYWKDQQGNKKEETTFVDVDVWGKSAEFCRDYLHKGNRVLVEGRLKLDTWDDRQSGQKRQKLGVVGENIQNLSPRTDDTSGHGNTQQRQNNAPQPSNPPPPPFPGSTSSSNSNPPPEFPTDTRGNSAGMQNPSYGEGYEVTDESIDDIPF